MDFGFLVKRAEKLVADNAPAILTAIGATGVVATALLVGTASFRAAKIIAAEEAAEAVFDTEPAEPTPKEKDAEFARQLEHDGMSVDDIAIKMERPEKTVLALLKLGEKIEEAAASRPAFVLDKQQRTKLRFKLVWKEYVPAVVIGTITLTAIFGANHISTRRAAALASAFTVSQKLADEYKDKVLAKIGKNKEGQIRDEIAQDQADRAVALAPNQDVQFLKPGMHWWVDGFSGRFFQSDMETVRGIVNDFNEDLLKSGSASLSDFWEKFGLDSTDCSDELGWTDQGIMRPDYRLADTKYGPTYVISFAVKPIRDFYLFNGR
jgi:hypothetical protein